MGKKIFNHKIIKILIFMGVIILIGMIVLSLTQAIFCWITERLFRLIQSISMAVMLTIWGTAIIFDNIYKKGGGNDNATKERK